MTLILLVCAAAWAAEEKSTDRRSFPNVTAVEVDNIHGWIHVTGVDGAEMRMVVNRHASGRNQSEIEAARRDVKLEITSEGGRVRLYVDGPFRERNHHWNENYQVRYDFELHVPRGAELKLRSVNDGDIVVNGVRGRFDVSHVNGPIGMTGLAGEGSARTVNGAINLAFAAEPPGSVLVKTVNGQITAAFPKSLNAGLSFQTLNGEVFTDFEFRPDSQPASGERRDGKWVYRRRHNAAVRVGTGGPGHKFETVNGNIQIREAKQ